MCFCDVIIHHVDNKKCFALQTTFDKIILLEIRILLSPLSLKLGLKIWKLLEVVRCSLISTLSYGAWYSSCLFILLSFMQEKISTFVGHQTVIQ